MTRQKQQDRLHDDTSRAKTDLQLLQQKIIFDANTADEVAKGEKSDLSCQTWVPD